MLFYGKAFRISQNIKSVSVDLFNLVEQFKDHPEVKDMHSYKLLERILKCLKKATLFPVPKIMYRLGQKRRKPDTPLHLILNTAASAPFRKLVR